MRYLGIEPIRPAIGVFSFTCCEGCVLQLANKEETLGPFLEAVRIVNFREVTSEKGSDYEIALIEGSISRSDEVERLRKIRQQAKVLVALGSCACFGGINRLKDVFTMDEANRLVYGSHPKESWPTRAIHEVVKVDLSIPGCPISKTEIEHIIQHVVLELPWQYPAYPVCVECKQRFTVCMFEKGQICLGPLTRAGCDAPCPAGGLGCWGCRGPAADPNRKEFDALVAERGFSRQDIEDRLSFFGGFEGSKQ
jgi:coenzyme F420-reducing hydrogenase gamma subunit